MYERNNEFSITKTCSGIVIDSIFEPENEYDSIVVKLSGNSNVFKLPVFANEYVLIVWTFPTNITEFKFKQL